VTGREVDVAAPASDTVRPVAPPTGRPLVEAVGLSKHYRVGRAVTASRRQLLRAVDGVDLSIGHSETVGLIGESGSGKSTFGRAILRLLPLTSGTLRFDGPT